MQTHFSALFHLQCVWYIFPHVNSKITQIVVFLMYFKATCYQNWHRHQLFHY